MSRRDVVLTGLPRSGTTLACLLLNELPDTVALSEPFNPGMFAEVSSEEEACDVIERFYRRMRRKILRQGGAISRHVGGEVTDNLFGDTSSDTGKRSLRAGKGRIPVDKELTRDFSLVIKTPGRFTAHLPALTRRFPALAIIRNPRYPFWPPGTARSATTRTCPASSRRRQTAWNGNCACCPGGTNGFTPRSMLTTSSPMRTS